MAQMSNSYTPLVFHQGNHGNWLLWCLEYFGNPNHASLENPFNTNGAAHQHPFRKENNNGDLIDDYFVWREYKRSAQPRNSNIVLMHPPKFGGADAYKNFIKCIGEDVPKTILIKYDQARALDQMNNAIERANHGGVLWLKICNLILNKREEFEKIYQIEIPYATAVEEKSKIVKSIPKWILREMLSGFDLLTMSHIEHNINYSSLTQSNFLMVSLDELYNDFENAIRKCIEYLGQPYQLQNQDKISTMYNYWISKQVHKDKDSVVKQIINSIQGNDNFEWSQLSVVDESVIQRELGKKGINLKVWNLNEFPTTLTDLRKICE